MASEQFSVSWDNFYKNMSSGMNSLLETEDFVDVTLAVEGRYLKAHKMVLSVCSPYFNHLFKTNPCTHPIVFMKDVPYNVMNDLLQFMYQGEAQVSQDNLPAFVKTAESLQIKGLSNYGNTAKTSTDQPPTENVVGPEIPPVERLNRADKQKISSVIATDPIQAPFVKTEPKTVVVAETTSTPAAEMLQFKVEPYDEEQSTVGNFSDDPLDLDDTNDDYWMTGEIDEDEHVGTGAQSALKGLLLNEMEDAVVSVTSPSSLIPERSKEQYEHTFTRFEQWCGENDIKTINENVLITYFKEKSVNYKPSSLWSMYSMLRSMITIRKNIDISKYRNLLAFLKRKSKGYKAKKSEVLRREDFEKFLREASNELFLMMKVAMIIGVAGACRRDELTYLLTKNVIDEGNFIRIQVTDSKNNASREFIVTAGNIENVNLIEIVRKYMHLRPATTDHQRFFVSYRHGKCTKQPVGINTFGSIPKSIAQFLGLQNPEHYTGHCFRRTSATFKLAPQLIHFP